MIGNESKCEIKFDLKLRTKGGKIEQSELFCCFADKTNYVCILYTISRTLCQACINFNA